MAQNTNPNVIALVYAFLMDTHKEAAKAFASKFNPGRLAEDSATLNQVVEYFERSCIDRVMEQQPRPFILRAEAAPFEDSNSDSHELSEQENLVVASPTQAREEMAAAVVKRKQKSSDEDSSDDEDEAPKTAAPPAKKASTDVSRVAKAGKKQESSSDEEDEEQEVMYKILEHLDEQEFKQVRLVNIERCGLILLDCWNNGDRRSSSGGSNFVRMRKKEIPALPQPELSADVEISTWISTLPPDQAFNQLSPLGVVVTRFTPEHVPLKLVLPFILQYSSSLEFLKLFARNCGDYSIPERLTQDMEFPQLQHVVVDINTTGTSSKAVSPFPSVVATITQASPNLERFQTSGNHRAEKLTNQIFRLVDIGNVRTLKFEEFSLEKPTLAHLASVPFRKLEVLSVVDHDLGHGGSALLAVVRNAAPTLRKLSLSGFVSGETEDFQVCQNVRELRLDLFKNWTTFVSRCFPSLESVAVGTLPRKLGKRIESVTPPFVPYLSSQVLHSRG